ARNLDSYGHMDGIIFVQPEDRDQGFLCKMAKGEGASASVCRFMVRYNIDQLLQRPVLHQWLQNGKLYREASEQQSSRFELFFDLLFVGMVHQVSEAAAEEPTGIGFAKYVLTFAPAFSIWSDVRDVANQFANDDVTQRAYILWIMMLLVGYSNNASSIAFGKSEGDLESMNDESLTALRWTLGFFVVAKLSKIILYLVYGLFLPMSRQPLFVNSIGSVVLTVLFFIAIFTPLHGTITIVAVGIVLDHALRILGILLYKTVEILGKKYDKAKNSCPWSATDPAESPGLEKTEGERGPLDGVRTVNSSMTAADVAAAINIEHHVERLGAFVTICLGEMVISVFFTSPTPVGLNAEAGRALLGLMIAFNLNWMYFGSQACKHFVHAIRRHWLAGFVFTSLHLPLCMSLLLASSAINRLVVSASTDSELGGGLKWFFGAGLGASVCIMATIGVLHKNLDDQDGVGAAAVAHARAVRKRSAIRRTISRRVVLGRGTWRGLR
ncbi:hypothetical protein B0H10DRAFT_1806889, partial [Mycena sp. CBHHK59/15]